MRRTLTLSRDNCIRLAGLMRANGVPAGNIEITPTLIAMLNAEDIPFILHCSGATSANKMVVDEGQVHRLTVVTNNGGQTCSICLEQLAKNDPIVRLQCTHMFHASCVDAWVETKNECPLCRAIIPIHFI